MPSFSSAADKFHYPSAYYLGFEIYICRELFTEKTHQLLQWCHIDIDRLFRLYHHEKLSILKTELPIQRLWTELYTTPDPDQGLITLNILKILHILTEDISRH